MIDEELLARNAQCSRHGEEQVLLGGRIAKRGVEDAREEGASTEAAFIAVDDGFDFLRSMGVHACEDRPAERAAQ